MTTTLTGIASWTEFLTAREVPVLRQTAHAITQARARAERINIREVADIVLHDPLMTARVLRFSVRQRGRRQLQDISTVEHAVMMLGVEPFFHHFVQFEVVEEQLAAHPQALLGLLHVIRRAQRAARYALDWATWRCDLNSEEVAVAALLHDLAEMLIWCVAPRQALEVAALRKSHPAMRTADAYEAVLHFPLEGLQAALCRTWELPELLLNLMDDSHSERPRVKNVKLAVDLARHSAKGWDDPALPDDFRAIARLMNIDEETLMLRLGLKHPGTGPSSEGAPVPRG
ncbi:MAG TPA: HDOD domain-containing protein [Noviherbaspirillum sp.]|uniref:HDOD domain-containing protein n=1 Tax=Noviherbaspirillum sp. TaxID=1926288 RepID=UPI002B47BB69|nr:HDOD domain-containing protein [Noviherbaspirillum sp.]HJV86243.1 HDOD domain-containing protein [Noviherbaspirillum sp.]